MTLALDEKALQATIAARGISAARAGDTDRMPVQRSSPPPQFAWRLGPQATSLISGRLALPDSECRRGWGV
jgi:hypothetical protein